MSASKIGFPRYVGRGETIYATKITGMATDHGSGYTLLEFGDLGKSTYAIPQWVGEHQPDIGGYFVVTDRGVRTHGRFMSAAEFIQNYTSAE